MKKMNKKLTTLMLAGALCAATIGGVVTARPFASSADEKVAKTYALSDVFSVSKAELKADETNSSLTALTFSDEGKVTFKRDLAFKWYEGKNNAKYLTLTFAFKDLNFKSVSFTFESEAAWATEDGKATNVITFTNNNGNVSVKVNDTESSTAIKAGQDVALSLAGSEADGEYGVMLSVDGSATKVGSLVNVGGNFADYSASKMLPLVISADVTDAEESEEKAVVFLKEINGQRFDNLKPKSESDTTPVVADTAAPVLVVNEVISGFHIGTAFALEYVVIDVLQSSNYTENKTYYQYNPTVKAEDVKYNELTTSTTFMDTVYTTESGRVTSVWKEQNKEFVSIKFELGDSTYSESEGVFAKKTYDLAWYAESSALTSFESLADVEFIVIDGSDEGPKFNHLKLDEEKKENVYVDKETFDAQVAVYQKLLADEASDKYAGSNEYFYFPSLKWLIGDNDGYQELLFTISYKKPSSSTAQASSNLSASSLKIAVPDEGVYELKIFAADKGSNSMQYYLDGELVNVTTNNVWDIDEIPSFTFEIKNRGLKIDSEDSTKTSDKKAEEDLNETYTFSSFKVKGASSLKENYALFVFDTEAGRKLGITESALTTVTFKQLREKMEAGLKDVEDGKYIEYYIECYSALLAEKVGLTDKQDAIEALFRQINEYDSRITEENAPNEWNEYNKYNWSVSSKKFKAAEEGIYVIVADYWEEELPMQRAAAYKIVVVDSEVDTIKGVTLSWIKNNLASVILFGIAGLMLIAIIVLLLIKPSDETLEDIDEKVAKKSKKAKAENEETKEESEDKE